MDNHDHKQIELEHILIELKNKRGQHLRHFIDQFFCYKHNYVTKTGNAKWSDITWREFVSHSAKNIKGIEGKKFVKEHIVPIQRIKKELLKLKNPSVESIEALLDELVLFATITSDEDKMLRDAKLTSSMPEGFDDPSHEFYRDPLARYNAVGIKVENYLKK